MDKKKVDKRTERIINDCKSRGGRVNQVMKDKTKYDRQTGKTNTKKEITKWKTEQDNQ